MTTTQNVQGDTLTISLNGRLDTTTAPVFQQELLAAFSGQKVNVTLDFTDIAYVSSAGLRVLLIGKKTATSKGVGFAVSHLSNEVLEVLKLTGFDKVLDIQ
jgi:anti-anti-sigma factor